MEWGPSTIPCCQCGGEVVEFSVPSDVWNAVIRNGGPETDKEYLCLKCFSEKAVDWIQLRLEEGWDDPKVSMHTVRPEFTEDKLSLMIPDDDCPTIQPNSSYTVRARLVEAGPIPFAAPDEEDMVFDFEGADWERYGALRAERQKEAIKRGRSNLWTLAKPCLIELWRGFMKRQDRAERRRRVSEYLKPWREDDATRRKLLRISLRAYRSRIRR